MRTESPATALTPLVIWTPCESSVQACCVSMAPLPSLFADLLAVARVGARQMLRPTRRTLARILHLYNSLKHGGGGLA